jgi:hypothetical protein
MIIYEGRNIYFRLAKYIHNELGEISNLLSFCMWPVNPCPAGHVRCGVQMFDTSLFPTAQIIPLTLSGD